MSSYSVIPFIVIGVTTAVVFRFIKSEYRAVFLCAVSMLLYYIWAGPSASMVLLIEMVTGYSVICAIRSGKHARIWMFTGIMIVLMCLSFFKYKGSFVLPDSVLSRLVMPLGISYYSFKTVSIIVDTYRDPSSCISLPDYLVYISFFPQLICGPISRYAEIKNYRHIQVDHEDVIQGMYIILRGLFYKAVIADRLAVYTDSVFDSYNSFAFPALWMAALFFSIQLYCDFAGYSYIVIGIGRLMGFNISVNFNLPYFSATIREFWDRWHISLSSWLKDYIYIPLGGNRKGHLRRSINVIAVFMISGAWHGNTGAYIIWGLWHGLWSLLSPEEVTGHFKRTLSTIGTFMIVMFGWITFKTESLRELVSYISGMFRFEKISYGVITESIIPFSGDYSSVAKSLTAGMIILILFVIEYRDYHEHTENRSLRAILYLVMIILFGSFGNNGFIYAGY